MSEQGCGQAWRAGTIWGHAGNKWPRTSELLGRAAGSAVHVTTWGGGPGSGVRGEGGAERARPMGRRRALSSLICQPPISVAGPQRGPGCRAAPPGSPPAGWHPARACGRTDLDSARNPGAVHPTGHVDRVSPDVVLRPASPDHSGHHRAHVDAWKQAPCGISEMPPGQALPRPEAGPGVTWRVPFPRSPARSTAATCPHPAASRRSSGSCPASWTGPRGYLGSGPRSDHSVSGRSAGDAGPSRCGLRVQLAGRARKCRGPLQRVRPEPRPAAPSRSALARGPF